MEREFSILWKPNVRDGWLYPSEEEGDMERTGQEQVEIHGKDGAVIERAGSDHVLYGSYGVEVFHKAHGSEGIQERRLYPWWRISKIVRREVGDGDSAR